VTAAENSISFNTFEHNKPTQNHVLAQLGFREHTEQNHFCRLYLLLSKARQNCAQSDEHKGEFNGVACSSLGFINFHATHPQDMSTMFDR